jgi:hypothetical protein
MKRIKPAFLLFFALLTTGRLFGQSFEVPANYAFGTKADYARYEPEVIRAVNWLEATPLNQDVAKRKEVNAFLFKYIEGSPTVTVELRQFVLELNKKNPDLLMVFMGGWTRHKLENPAQTDPLKLNTAGVQTVLKVYQLGGARKDKGLEKLIQLAGAGELEAWVKSKLS